MICFKPSLWLLGENGKENLSRDEARRPVRRLGQFSRADIMVVFPGTMTIGMVRNGYIWQIY